MFRHFRIIIIREFTANDLLENLSKLEVKQLNFIDCISNSCNLKNVCNLVSHWF